MAEGVSIGNFKGVMLCNRPLATGAPSSDAPKAAGGGGGGGGGGSGDGPGPYRAGIIPERVNPRGYDPSLFERLVSGVVAACACAALPVRQNVDWSALVFGRAVRASGVWSCVVGAAAGVSRIPGEHPRPA
jgi:hypothetical protein